MNRGWPKGLGYRRGSYNVTQEQQRWQANAGWGWQFRQLQNGGSETRQALPQSTGASVQHSHLEDEWGWGNRNGSNWQSGEDWRTTNHQGPNAINRGHSFDRGSSGTSAQPSYPLSEQHWQSGNPGASWNLAQQHQYLNSLPNDCFQQRFLQPTPSLDDWHELPFHNSSMLTWKDMDDMGLGMIRFESSNQFQSRCQAQGKGKAIQVGQDVKSKNKRLQGQSDGPNMDRNKIFQSLKAAGTGIKETTKGQLDKVKNLFKPKPKEEPFKNLRNLDPNWTTRDVFGVSLREVLDEISPNVEKKMEVKSAGEEEDKVTGQRLSEVISKEGIEIGLTLDPYLLDAAELERAQKQEDESREEDIMLWEEGWGRDFRLIKLGEEEEEEDLRSPQWEEVRKVI